MDIASLLLFIFASIGLTHIVVHGKVFDEIRMQIDKNRPKILGLELYDIVTCYQCAGMWVGIISAIAMTPFWGINWSPSMRVLYPGFVILAGGATSYLAALAGQINDWFTFNIGIPIFDDEDTEEIKPSRN